MNQAPERVAPTKKRGRHRSALWRYLGVAVTSIALLLAAAVPAAAAELMRVTFVRHGESAGNASGLIDTSTPGPVLTPLGQQQAQDVVGTLGDNNYDAIYASTMVRTQLTAAPMSQYLRLPIQVLPGLQEIEAGAFEGTPEASAAGGYGLYPIGWTFPGVIPQIPVEMFNRSTFMPGTALNGYVFDSRVDGALQTMYDNGDRNPVVFSHGGAIMFWTMMNVTNLSVMEKLQLLQTARLDNTDYVIIEGNNEDGWTLVNWNGQQFAPEPTLGAEVALQVRTLTRQLAATANQVVEAFATRNIGTILTAINRAVADATFSIVKFTRTVNAKLIGALDNFVSPPATESEEESTPHTVAAAVTSDTDPSAAAARTTAATSSAGDDNVVPLRADKTEAAVETTDDAESTEPEATADEESGTDEGAASDATNDANDADEAPPGTRETDTAAQDGDDADNAEPADTTSPDSGSSGTGGDDASGDAGGDAGNGSSEAA